ncbi:hypothetical protein FIU83_05185 [Halomonas sp. THAF5a]|nr:hypothetical protein FIU83_05185 [Halomonas sp. THAF5a]
MDSNSRFPDIGLTKSTDSNRAVRAFGRRFYRDQTPLEYLAEFLLCFSSEKTLSGDVKASGLPLLDALPRQTLEYWPESRLALKLFSFFPSSKLETRHPTHVERFKQLISDLEATVDAEHDDDKRKAVAVLQQLFSGFVGVAGQRTWATHSFIPASRFLLSREVDWRHTQAVKEKVQTWGAAQAFFTTGSHNFMARGGEVLFLQLWHVLRVMEIDKLEKWLQDNNYHHIAHAWSKVGERVEAGLNGLMAAIDDPLARLGNAVEWAAGQDPTIQELASSQSFGWVPRASWQEAALFAWELSNITSSQQDPLRQVRVMQDLCCLHVLRSLCFQSVRLLREDVYDQATKFAGGYAWITVAPQAGLGTDLGKVSHASQGATEELLFKAIRSEAVPELSSTVPIEETKGNPDDHGFKLFRSLGKQIGLIVPRNGPMRFTLSSSLVETAVLALISPGERVRFDVFLWRLYRHFGIAVGASQIEAALVTLNHGVRLSPQSDCAAWLEDELKRGGFLIPLSDATPLVENSK